MGTFTLNGYDSYSGCDIMVTARLNTISGLSKELKEKIYTLGSLQTLSISTHQDKKPVRVIGSVNALDYTMGQRTIAGSLVFAVFDQHFATEMFDDLSKATGKTFLLPDELPGIDITINFANEYGRTSRMAIYGVRIINEGQVMSINDLYTENTYQFVAVAMEPLKKGEQAGSGGVDKPVIEIVPDTSTKAKTIDYSGEDIYSINNSLSIEDIEKVTLTANIEQPKYNEEEGLVKFYLSPSQSSGVIYISDKKRDKVILELEVDQYTKQYYCYLKEGLYSAWFENKNQLSSNVVNFNIVISNFNFDGYDDTPIIESITSSSITLLSNNPTHTIGVAVNKESLKLYESEIKSRLCTINNLESDTEYFVYTKESDNLSKNCTTKTLAESFDIIADFKKYVEYNKNLLSLPLDNYLDILERLEDNILNSLTKEKSSLSKEIIFMAIKYNNELIKSINSYNHYNIATKVDDNVFGNTFKFNNSISKANIFISKNKKDYFDYSEEYPTEITYEGKNNTLYNSIGISNEFVKSPKYYFYCYSDNDKALLLNCFSKNELLSSIDLYTYSVNNKLSTTNLECLAIKDNKSIDIKLLKAPCGFIDDSLSLIVDLNYLEHVGNINTSYYLAICKHTEALDNSPIRKILISDFNSSILINNYISAIDDQSTYSIWIEDENYNIISEIGFVSKNEDTEDLIDHLFETSLNHISKKIETNINNPGYLSDIITNVSILNIDIKDITKELAKNIIDYKESECLSLIYELFKIEFETVCINKEKYNKVYINLYNNSVEFNASDSQIVHIKIRKDNVDVNTDYSNKAYIDNNYDINIFYMINNNPIIKSGFIIFKNNDYKSYLINTEEI